MPAPGLTHSIVLSQTVKSATAASTANVGDGHEVRPASAIDRDRYRHAGGLYGPLVASPPAPRPISRSAPSSRRATASPRVAGPQGDTTHPQSPRRDAGARVLPASSSTFYQSSSLAESSWADRHRPATAGVIVRTQGGRGGGMSDGTPPRPLTSSGGRYQLAACPPAASGSVPPLNMTPSTLGLNSESAIGGSFAPPMPNMLDDFEQEEGRGDGETFLADWSEEAGGLDGGHSAIGAVAELGVTGNEFFASVLEEQMAMASDGDGGAGDGGSGDGENGEGEGVVPADFDAAVPASATPAALDLVASAAPLSPSSSLSLKPKLVHQRTSRRWRSPRPASPPGPESAPIEEPSGIDGHVSGGQQQQQQHHSSPQQHSSPSQQSPSQQSPSQQSPPLVGPLEAPTQSALIEALQKVSWFRRLPEEQLATLASRGRLECCLRYRTIIREGSRGRYFYVLLQGSVHCTSSTKKGLSVRLGPGSSFGETALVTTVQREASVAALEPCQLMLLSADDIKGLDVDLSVVRKHVIQGFLERLPFFGDLAARQREMLSSLMELRYSPKGSVIFEEGDVGDCFYVLLEGHVEMRKRSANNQRIASFRPTSERPWFGEIAMLGGSSKTRSAAALCLDAVKALVVRQAHFVRFLEVAPAFNGMFQSSASGYAALDEMRRMLDGEDDIIKSGVALLKSKVGKWFSESDGSSFLFGSGRNADEDEAEELTEQQQAIYARWKSLLEPVLSRVRASENDGEEKEGEGDGDETQTEEEAKQQIAEEQAAEEQAEMQAADEEKEGGVDGGGASGEGASTGE